MKCFLLLLSLILVHNLFVNVAFLFFIISSLCLGLPNFGQLKAKGGLFWNYHIFANLFIASISKMSKGLAAFIQLVKVRRVTWFWHFWAYNFHNLLPDHLWQWEENFFRTHILGWPSVWLSLQTIFCTRPAPLDEQQKQQPQGVTGVTRGDGTVEGKSDARKCQSHVTLLTLTSWVKDVSPFELAPLFRWWRPRSQSRCADTAVSSQKGKQILQLQRGMHSLFQL